MSVRRGLSIFNDITQTGSSNADRDSASQLRAKVLEYRNTLLLHRYYFYTKIVKGLSYDAVMYELQREFFLQQLQIGRIVTENVTMIKDIIKESPTAKELTKKYQHLNWRVEDYANIIKG